MLGYRIKFLAHHGPPIGGEWAVPSEGHLTEVEERSSHSGLEDPVRLVEVRQSPLLGLPFLALAAAVATLVLAGGLCMLLRQN